MRNVDRALSEIEYEALANLRYRIRKFRQFSGKAAEKLGLTRQQHQALLAIKGLGVGGRMSLSGLAEKLFTFAGRGRRTCSFAAGGRPCHDRRETEAPAGSYVDSTGRRAIASSNARSSL